MFENKIYGMILLAAFIFVLSGCGSDGKMTQSLKEENRLVYASETEYAGLNPILEETNVDALLFRGLMRFNEQNEPTMDIAQSVDISADRLTYTFKLKENIKFHDSRPLTSDDVIFTIESILDDNNASFLKSSFTAIQSIWKLDDYRLKVKLKHPYAPFLDKMTVPILPKHAFAGEEMRTSSFNSMPIGTGPYQFSSWERGNSLILEAYKGFHGAQPAIQQVIFKFIPDGNVRALQLKSGEVDIALLDPVQAESLEDEETIALHALETADYRGLLYNMKTPLWKDKRIRQAFNYATNREQIVEGILRDHGTPAYSPLQKHPFHNEDIEKYSYDLPQANRLLDAAGWRKEEDGFRYKKGQKLAFTITAPVSDQVRVNIANYLAEEYKKIGADVKIEAIDWSAIQIDESDAFVIAWGSPYDADHHTYSVFHSEQSSATSAGYNYGSYSNSKVDQLLEQGRLSADELERKSAYLEFQKELSEDPPFDFIVYVDAIYGINKNLEGVQERTLGHHGSGFLWNVEEWKWNDR